MANKAAERLRERFRSDEDVSLTDLAADLDEALRYEHRATAQRIRPVMTELLAIAEAALLQDAVEREPTRAVMQAALAILDEEAARP